MDIERNDPCHCGSGKKYKRCHLDIDRDAQVALREALPIIAERNANIARVDRRLREEYGVYIDFVPPIVWNDRKVWVLGSGFYLNRPPNETFHEFLIHVLCVTLGEDWRATQAALPEAARHVVVKCLEDWSRWKALNADADVLARDGHQSAFPSGWVQYLISLAWDVATILRTGALPEALLNRLREMTAFRAHGTSWRSQRSSLA